MENFVALNLYWFVLAPDGLLTDNDALKSSEFVFFLFVALFFQICQNIAVMLSDTSSDF